MKTPAHWKDILIGLLVAWIVIDLLLAYALQSHEPSILKALSGAAMNENMMVVLVIAFGAGILAYYLASRSRDFFTPMTKMV